MSRFDFAYRALLGFLVVMGVLTVAAGSIGLYTVLTGGTGDDAPEVDVLGAYGCEEFDADPPVVHNSSYGIERTLVSGDAIAAVNTSTTGNRVRMRVDVAGGILAASASRPDGTPVPVERVDGEDRVTIETSNTGPFRLWIDSVSREAAVTRTRLDVCPPA